MKLEDTYKENELVSSCYRLRTRCSVSSLHCVRGAIKIPTAFSLILQLWQLCDNLLRSQLQGYMPETERYVDRTYSWKGGASMHGVPREACQSCGCTSTVRCRQYHGSSAFTGWLCSGYQARSCLPRSHCL